MKTLVLYDSKYGNTKIIAEIVAGEVAGEVMNVVDFTPAALSEVDIVVVGSPIQGFRPSAATTLLLTHLDGQALKGKAVAAFDTGYSSRFAGNAAAKMMKALHKAGGMPLLPTQKFIVESQTGPLGPDETARARQWAQDLKAAYAQVIHHAAPIL